MRRLISTLLLAAVTLVNPVSAARPVLLDSIRPVQWENFDQDENITLRNHCTAGLISRKGYWLSAAHCVSEDQQTVSYKPYYISDRPAKVVAADFTYDLAIFKVDPLNGLRVLKLAKTAPDYDTYVETAGYSFGLPLTFWFKGYVSNPFYVFPGEYRGYMMLAVPVVGGQSGSPIVNQKGEVVSVVQIGFARGTFGPVMGGVPFYQLKWFAEKYFDK